MTKTEETAVVVAAQPSALDMIQTVIDKGVTADSVEVLSRLVELHERVEKRSAEKEFAQDLADFQAKCPPIPKESVAEIVSKRSGSRFAYSYASLDGIAKHVGPHLHERGFSYTWDSETTERVVKATCRLRHVNGAEMAAHFSAPVDPDARMNVQQSHAAALTYAKRQALIQVLGVTTAEPDPDGETGPGAEPILPSEVEAIEQEIVESGADRDKVLKWLGVERMEDVQARDYNRLLAALERKRQQGAKA